MLMAIAIDTRWLHVKAGVANQIIGLMGGLAQCDQEHNYLSFGINPGIKQDNFQHYDLSGWRRKIYQGLWKTLRFPPLEFLLGEQQLVHFTNATMVPVRSARTKLVLTVHDLAFLHFPEAIERRNLRFLQEFCPPAIQRADRIVAVSQSTKNDIVNKFGVQEEKIVVIPNAAAGNFQPQDPERCRIIIQERYQVAKPYLLFVGTMEPRKNVTLLLAACEQLAPELQQVYALVLIGMKGWQQSGLQHAIAKLQEKMTVITPGYISQEELPLFYGAAKLFVFPSLFEGFGIPALEAMACGTPVLVANNSSLPEVVGAAAMLFANNNVADLKEKLLILLKDNQLREQMREKGFQQAQKFSWLASGKKLRDLYAELL